MIAMPTINMVATGMNVTMDQIIVVDTDAKVQIRA